MATYTVIGSTSLKNITVGKVYTCDICGEAGPIDAPHKSGPWANFCESCFLTEAAPNQPAGLGTYARTYTRKKASR